MHSFSFAASADFSAAFIAAYGDASSFAACPTMPSDALAIVSRSDQVLPNTWGVLALQKKGRIDVRRQRKVTRLGPCSHPLADKAGESEGPSKVISPGAIFPRRRLSPSSPIMN